MSPSTLPEPVLFQLLLQKDREAFSYLYDKYHCALFGVITRIVNRQEVAENILTETFLHAYNNFGQYNAKNGRLFTWLHVIARNKSLEFMEGASQDSRSDSSNVRIDNQRFWNLPSVISAMDYGMGC